jgi:predicted AlkP superfamily phosphohydrolase/phosphomutase
MTSSNPKVIILGLDGATFDLLDPLIAQGVMPNLQQILAGGIRGRLTSTIPPTTAPAWTTFLSGLNPGRHGVFDFRHRAGGNLSWVSRHSIRVPMIWNIVNTAGQSAGIINVPLTYPPDTTTDGYMLAGFLTPSNSCEYMYPPALQEQLEQAIGEYIIYEPIPPLGLDEKEEIERYLNRIQHMVSQRAKALCWLMANHPVQLVMIVFQALDTLQHSFWKYLDPREAASRSEVGKAIRPALLKCYRQIDDILGQILQCLGKDSYIVLGSDHGFGAHSHSFLVNEWLAQQGLLKYDRHKLIAEKVWRRIRNRLNLGSAKEPLLEKTTRFVPEHKSAVDWSHTRAYSGEVHQQAIYINVRGREPKGIVEPGDEYESLCSEIIELADELTNPATGQHIRCHIYRREEVYNGPFVDQAPDLAIIVDDYNYQVITNFSLRGQCFQDQPLPLGTHRRDGILAISGPGVKTGCELHPISIADVTPTVLYLMGLAVPEGLDGNVLIEAFCPEWVEAHPIHYGDATPAVDPASDAVYSSSDEAEIASRLQGLGYLD